jgi:hypothetical protein
MREDTRTRTRLPALFVAALGILLVATIGPAGVAVPPARAAAPTLPAVPAAWPFTTFQLGLADEPGDAAALHASAPLGMRYQYLAGGVNTNEGWQTWNTGGQFVNYYVADSAAAGMVPIFTYYMLLQSNPAGGDEAAQDLAHLKSPAVMKAYWADVKAFFVHAKTTTPVILHVEPDLWGYIEQAASGDNATTVPASVGSSGFGDLSGYANNAAGFAKAFVRLRDLYAPNVVLAYHLSGWGTNVDLHANHPTDAETDALAIRAAAFYASLGASFDVVFTDIADRDAGWRQYDPNNGSGDGGASWWTAPDFARWGRFIAGFVAASGRRVAVWQIPLGNTRMRAMNNSRGHYQDNRVEWFLDDLADGHLGAWRDVGVIALLYGGGAQYTTCACDAMGDGTTNPAAINGNTRASLSADDDGGYFKEKASAFYAEGGLSLPAPTPTPAPARWTVSATLSATTIHRRHSLRIATKVTASRATRALVDVEVYDPLGRKVAQHSWAASSFKAATARVFAWRWYVGSTRRLGRYTVKVGIFGPSWSPLLTWRDRVRTFVVRR